MANNNAMVKVFENEQFGQVRIIIEDGKYLFCGNDVAKALGYNRPGKAIIDHCKGVLKRDTLTNSGVQSMSYILEGDVYRLIVRSKLPTAEKFESWVFDEVLPTLRKTGTYSMQDAIFEKFPQTPRDYRSALLALVDQIDINESLTKQNKILSGEKLMWDNSALLNALIRKYASYACDNKFGVAWKSFYKELLYKHGLNLESRKSRDLDKNPKNLNRATYKYLSNEEWQGAIETAVAMCVANNVDISTIIKEKVQTEEMAVC